MDLDYEDIVVFDTKMVIFEKDSFVLYNKE
jgi:hypothetical protein